MKPADLDELTDYELSTFIVQMDREPVQVNDFEHRFITSNATRSRPRFTEKQRAVITKMIDKYAVQIGWDRPMRSEQQDIPF